MNEYGKRVLAELLPWQNKMKKSPSLVNRVSKNLQMRLNRVIPEKIHRMITKAIEHMTRAVRSGATFTTSKLLKEVEFYWALPTSRYG